MTKHVKAYHAAAKIHPGDFIECEECHAPAVDIHHIDEKGMGGSKHKDGAENLIALCRWCHERAHRGAIPKDAMKAKVMARLEKSGFFKAAGE